MAIGAVVTRNHFCLRCFHPGWYAAVMGTAIVGIMLAANPGNWAVLRPAAQTGARVVAVLVAVLMLGLAIPYILRWIGHPSEALADFRSPTLGPLYATVPAGFLVAAVMAGSVGPLMIAPALVHALVFWLAWVGVPLTFVVSVASMYSLLAARSTPMESVNGAWFIPPVANIIVPVVLSQLMPGAGPDMSRLLLFTGYGFWGMGFILFLLVLSLLHDRLVIHQLPPAQQAPSLVIGLGPIGVGSLALLKMSAAGAPVLGAAAPTVAAVSMVGASILWGFGIWWFATTAVVMLRYLIRDPLPYGLGWWAFTFPVGAFTMATLGLARAWNIGGVEYLGVALAALLIVLWLTVSLRTLLASLSGEAWSPAHRRGLTPVPGPAPV